MSGFKPAPVPADSRNVAARRRLLVVALAYALHAAAPPAGAAGPEPPAQPADGPGGSAAPHRTVRARQYGTGATAYWLFEPADPTPTRARLIVFLHGWSALEPAPYGAWIDHLVKRGNVVVYPLYQKDLGTPVRDFTANAVTAVRAAMHRLAGEPGHVPVEAERCAVAGHSMGGVLAANLAAGWRTMRIPRPAAVMSVEPGKTWGESRHIAIELDDQSRVAPETLLVTVTGDHDRLARDVDAKRIFRETTAVPAENKSYVVVTSDDHGTPPLVASHLFPVATNAAYARQRPTPGDPIRRWLQARIARRLGQEGSSGNAVAQSRGPDALDFYGTWKWLDALIDAAFDGTHREVALGNTAEQRFMGRWSDGVPVKEPLVLSSP
jgi:dienelactone hydrolase